MIHEELWRKLNHWVSRGGSHECSGMGKVVVSGDRLEVVDAWMVKQVNSGAETEMDADDFAKIMYQKREIPGSWYFWWHSHANMGVFWSGTDRDQITKLARNGACVALVLNTRGEHKCLVASGKPFLLYKDDVKVEVANLVTPEQKSAWDKEYDDKVSAKVWTASGYLGAHTGDWDDDDYLRRYRNGHSTAIGLATETRGSPRQPTSTLAESKEEKAKEAKKRLAQIGRQVPILEFQLRDRGPITKACANIIEIEWAPGLELESEITGMMRMGASYTIEDCINDTLVNLWEEETVLEEGLASYEINKAKQAPCSEADRMGN